MYTFEEAVHILSNAQIEFGVAIKEYCKEIQELLSQLESASGEKPENPKEKNDLEIFSRIEPYNDSN